MLVELLRTLPMFGSYIKSLWDTVYQLLPRSSQ